MIVAGNIAIKYPKDDKFKCSSPADRYELNMADIYERAICIKLLNILATNSFFAMEYFQYKAPTSKTFETISLKNTVYTVPDILLEDQQGKEH